MQEDEYPEGLAVVLCRVCDDVVRGNGVAAQDNVEDAGEEPEDAYEGEEVSG